MSILFLTLVVAYVATCTWLAVRIVNRRARWAMWILVASVLMPLLYIASYGPVSASVRPRGLIYGAQEDRLSLVCRVIYRPIVWAMKESPVFYGVMDRYCNLWQSNNQL